MPIHDRTTVARDGLITAAAMAASTGLGNEGFPRSRAVQRPVAGAGTHRHARPLYANLDLVELAVGRRLERVLADQVIRARVARDLFHAGGDVVAVDDRAPVGVFRQGPQRVHRRAEVLTVGLQPDALV